MHVVMDIAFGLLVHAAISFVGLGVCVAYMKYKRRDIDRARVDGENQEHEAWLIGLWDDAELFFTGSDVSNPKGSIS